MPGHGLLVDDIVLSARHCAAFAAAHRLACWVGEGVRVTLKQVLRPVDVPAAAQALGIPAPARVRTAVDVLALHRTWKVALAIGFLRIVDATRGPDQAFRSGPTSTTTPFASCG